jgi:hypothetical protein
MFKISYKKIKSKVPNLYCPVGHCVDQIRSQAFMWKTYDSREITHLVYNDILMKWEPVAIMNWSQYETAQRLLTT